MVKRPSRLQLYLRQFDYLLFGILLLTTLLGLFVLDGSTHDVLGLESYTRRQAVWWGVGCGIFLLIQFLPYSWFRVLGWPLYAISIASLLALSVLHLGVMESVAAGGAKSWVKISLGGSTLRLQPSEFTKIFVAIVLAHWLALREGKMRTIWECLVPALLVGVPVVLIFKQPDIGTASVFLPMLVVGLFTAGLNWKIVVATVVAGFLIGVCGVYYIMTADRIPGLRKYQQARLQVFLAPIAMPFRPPGVEEVLYGAPDTQKEQEDKGKTATLEPRKETQDQDPDAEKKMSGDDWNIRQAEMALGSGQILGKGWRKGTQARLKFLPEHYTDFIFSSLGEQFGLVGCVTLLFLYLLLAWRAFRIAVLTPDPFGRNMVLTLIAIFFTHIFLNIGMSIRLLPVTGLPLPLMSYGGSFLATNYLLFGLIANIGMRRNLAA